MSASPMASPSLPQEEKPGAPAPAGLEVAAVHLQKARDKSRDAVGGIAGSLHKTIVKRVGTMTRMDHETAEEMLTYYEGGCKHDKGYTKAELMHVIMDLKKSRSTTNYLKRVVCGLFLLMLLLIGAIFGTSLAAGEAIKESHVTNGLMTDRNGGSVKTSTASYKLGLFELPDMDFDTLTTIKTLDFVIDGRNTTTFDDDVVSASFTVTSVVQSTKSSIVTFFTPSGAVIKLNGVSKSGHITIEGNTLPVFESANDIADYNEGTSSGRRLIIISNPNRVGRGGTVSECPKGRKPFFMAVIKTWICIADNIKSAADPGKSQAGTVDGSNPAAPKTPAAPAPSPPPTACVPDQLPLDKDRRCSNWAERGFCTNTDYTVATTGETYAVYIPRKCACSCDVDATKTPETKTPAAPAAPSAPKTAAPAAPVKIPEECLDGDKKGRCPRWANEGYCSNTDLIVQATGETYAVHITNKCKTSCPQPAGSTCAAYQ